MIKIINFPSIKSIKHKQIIIKQQQHNNWLVAAMLHELYYCKFAQKQFFQATITKFVKKLLYPYKNINWLINELYYKLQHNTLIYTKYI